MLPIEQQVCSLELAKRLKELGMKQESLFWWSFVSCGDGCGNPKHVNGGWMITTNKESHDAVSAFTVAELGEMLPLGYKSSKINADWPDKKKGTDWYCEMLSDENNDIADAQTEADARAKMLIYLKENNLC